MYINDIKVTITQLTCIGDVMVSVHAFSAVDHRVKPKTMKLVLVASPISMQH